MAREGARPLTARDRFWLGHLRAIERSRGTATRYTRRKGLSTGALWHAALRLETLGARRCRARVREAARAGGMVSFARVAVPSAMVSSPAGVRLRVAGGVELEWTTAPPVEWLAALVEQIAKRA